MNRNLAESLSVAFHPLLVPSYIMILLMMAVPYTHHYNQEIGQFILGFTFVFTFVLPVLAMLILKQFGYIQNLRVAKRKERTVPFLITSFFFFACAYQLYGSQIINPVFPHILVIIGLCILLVSGVNLFQKVSAHAIGMSGFTAVVLRLSIRTNQDIFIYYMIAALLVTGIVCAARLALSAHKPKEIYTGVVLGFSVALISSFLLI